MKYENLTIREASLMINNKVASFLKEHSEIKEKLEQDGEEFQNNAGDIDVYCIDCKAYADDNPSQQSVYAEGLIDLYAKNNEVTSAEFKACLTWDCDEEEFTEVTSFTSINDIDYE